jgi:nucleoside-diphosphate-sugar epimerase
MIAVTGGRGFVGSAMVAALSRQSSHWSSILSIGRGRVNSHSEGLQEIGFENEDLRERLKEVKVFVHIAGASKGSPEVLWKANVSSLERYIEMLPATVEQIIHFSSVNVLFPELSPYGETKLKGERLWAESPFANRVTLLRPAVIYGPGDRQNMGRLIRLVDRFPVIPVPENGSMRPVFLEDLVDLVVKLIEQKSYAGKTIVVSGLEATNFRELVQRLAYHMHRRRVCLPLPDWLLKPLTEAVRFCGLKGLAQTIDGYRLNRPWHDPIVWQVLGRPTTGLDEGLRQCVEHDYHDRHLPSRSQAGIE